MLIDKKGREKSPALFFISTIGLLNKQKTLTREFDPWFVLDLAAKQDIGVDENQRELSPSIRDRNS